MEPEAEIKNSIKNWAVGDRPREKLAAKGVNALSDAELIAILLGSGTREGSALDVARRMMQKIDNDLLALGKLSVKDLMKEKGIGQARAIIIVAAIELGRRRRRFETEQKKNITSSKDVAEIFMSRIGDLPHEQFWLLLLNRANKVIGQELISSGGIAGTVVDTRIIFKKAIESLASSIILCHNHPSGNLKPSEADLSLTNRLKEAGKLLEIPVLDHIIVTDSSSFSFADEGLI